MSAVGRLPILIFAVCGVLALATAGCGGGDSSSSGSESSASTSESSEPTSTEPEEEQAEFLRPTPEVPKGRPPKSLALRDVVKGSGAAAEEGDEVTVNYVGVNYKSGKEFDASWDRNEPFTFTLGSGEVIPGWDQGIEGMKVGTRRELLIPPELAYGSQGSPPAIPPNETLYFLVDLVAVN